MRAIIKESAKGEKKPPFIGKNGKMIWSDICCVKGICTKKKYMELAKKYNAKLEKWEYEMLPIMTNNQCEDIIDFKKFGYWKQMLYDMMGAYEDDEVVFLIPDKLFPCFIDFKNGFGAIIAPLTKKGMDSERK